MSADRGRLWPARLFLVAVFCALMVFTRSIFSGDSYWYVLDIKNSFGQGLMEYGKLWDFPHVLWRPIGRILSDVFLPLILGHFHQNVETSITFLLMCLNLLATLICALVVQTAAWRLAGNRWAATLAATAFLCVSSVLNYSRSGSSYVFGLAFLLSALYVSGFYRSNSWKAAVGCGLLLGMAVLVWVPYVVSIPAVLLAGPVLKINDRFGGSRNMRFIVLSGLAATVIIAGFYGMAIDVHHIRSVPALIQWIHETSHDPDRHLKLLRMATGFPRSVYELGDVGRWIKWFLFRDPYANVGLLELLRVSLLKLVVFYVTLAGLALALWRSPLGRRLLHLIVMAMVPNLCMALMYESGSPERYLPFLPLVFLGFGYVLGSKELSGWARIWLGLLCCAHIPVNLAMLSAATVDRRFSNAANSISELTSLPPGSHLYVINEFDERAQLVFEAPFNPINQKPHPDLDSLVSSLGPRVPLWRSDFTSQALRTWNRSGEVWVTTRVLSEQPHRNWAWVEGDDHRITWNAIYQFFRAFDHTRTRGGDDGFFLIRDTKENRKILLANSRQASQSPDRDISGKAIQ